MSFSGIVELSTALVGLFMMLDALLAVILGKRYMMWGLEYAPAWYRALIMRISELPSPLLLGIKMAEFSLGLFLFLLAGKFLQKLYPS